jgi:hypothetical protein
MMDIVAIIPMTWSVCFGSLICGCDKMDSNMPKSITDPIHVGSKAYVNYIKLLKKKYRESKK